MLVQEVWLVFALSLGAAGAAALVSYLGAVTRPGPLRERTAQLNGTLAPGRPWLDLALQLLSIATALVPVLLVAHLLARSGESLATLGVERREPRRDAARGALLAAGVGGVGLGCYLATYHAGLNLTVVPENLPAVWWRTPVLLLSALQNGLLEEVLVVGYLLHRLRQLGWGDGRALAVSATLRGSYHLYQGLGAAAANAAMGVLFGRLYRRWGRVAPLVVAHTLVDAVAFVGYAALRGTVSWLPVPH
ncbi:MAG TPA: CPBP family intramembrane glutamic endopeptidase [Frankiaceae bacterium]|nr:CPBP family intramembrane glutamic endopeptidase [Frankiaceae bacterium]